MARPSPLSEKTARKRVIAVECEKAPKAALNASTKPAMVKAFRTVTGLRPRAISRSAAQPARIEIVPVPAKDMKVNQLDAANDKPNRSLK